MGKLRNLEKTKKIGYMFYIKYNGTKFHSFDEVDRKVTVKGEFKKILQKIGFSWAKGIQQAGRTDAKVSATENIMYLSSEMFWELSILQKRFNEVSGEYLKTTMIKRCFPNLEFPTLILKRGYTYKYPKKLILKSEEEIKNISKNLSGKYDVSAFTDKKGEILKEKIREVEIAYEGGVLNFLGTSFMPKQVRIMSGYILTGKKEPLEGKYLTLNRVILTDELKKLIFEEIDDYLIEDVEKIERTLDKKLNIFYVKKGKKGKIIGKNGTNIKCLKKIYGDIVVKEI